MTPAQRQTNGDVSFQHDQAKQSIFVVNKGYAELKNTNFSNGTIEFKTKFVGERITGITFRLRLHPLMRASGPTFIAH